MAMKCPECEFENYPTVSHCANCGTSFNGMEKPTVAPMDQQRPLFDPYARGERGRVSQLLYVGAGMIALSGLLDAVRINYILDERVPPSFVFYAGAVLIVGIALVIVGFARQARRMLEWA